MRLFEILINDRTFIAPTSGRQFRIQFDVVIDFGGFNTYMDLRIYNLTESTAARAFERETTIGLRAGYDTAIDYLFSGKIRNVFKERNGPDTITRIIARGGTSFAKPTINETYDKNANVTQLIRACADALGYPLVIDQNQFTDIDPYIRGSVLVGDPTKKLDELAQTHNFSYVLENNRIVVVRNGSFRQGQPTLISESTGMEGIPEITEVGCDVSVRLNPRLKIGGRIDIQSDLRTFNFSNIYYQDIPASAGSGVYNIFKLEHSGDSWGDDWTTRITGNR